MLNYFEIAQRNYERGLWSKAMLKVVVRKGQITRDQYRMITGEEYKA